MQIELIDLAPAGIEIFSVGRRPIKAYFQVVELGFEHGSRVNQIELAFQGINKADSRNPCPAAVFLPTGIEFLGINSVEDHLDAAVGHA